MEWLGLPGVHTSGCLAPVCAQACCQCSFTPYAQNAREQKYDQVREELEEAKRMRERGEEKFQTFVLEEVAALKNGLILESQVGEQPR